MKGYQGAGAYCLAAAELEDWPWTETRPWPATGPERLRVNIHAPAALNQCCTPPPAGDSAADLPYCSPLPKKNKKKKKKKKKLNFVLIFVQ